MSVYLPNNPSWDQVDAEIFTLTRVPSDLSFKFKKYFNNLEDVYKIERSELKDCNGDIKGHYLLTSNNKKVFVKIIDTNDYEQLLEAESFAKILYKNKIKTQVLLEGFPKSLNNNYSIFAYSYITNRFSKTKEIDITKISQEISNLHEVFKNIDSKKVFLNTEKREEFFLKEFDLKVELIGSISVTAKEFLLKYKDLLYRDFGNKQIIHGDLNFHNIIFDKNSDEILILDFEDVSHSYFSPLYDIAMILERFILLKDISSEEKFRLGMFLLKNFNRNYFKNNLLYKMLLYISVRSLLILATIFKEKNCTNTQEIEKFIKHIKHINTMKDLITKLEKAQIEKD